MQCSSEVPAQQMTHGVDDGHDEEVFHTMGRGHPHPTAHPGAPLVHNKPALKTARRKTATGLLDGCCNARA